jgi:ElaB/YqjD/DUF883 family membrane-anchored ribosome-binding protein
MTSKLEELAEKARKIAAETGESVKEKLSELPDSEDWEQLRQAAAGLGEDTAVFVRKYPIQSVLGAAAVGFLLGTALGRKSR